MDNEATARLKFDRRLAQRRNWVEREELENELASLPDCADKIGDGEAPAGVEAPAAPEFASPPVAPANREFGGGNSEA
jgi:hypothetical protein